MTFTLARPPHHDVGVLRGYRVQDGTWAPVATVDVDGDFDGWGMFTAPLVSPVPREVRVLVWGRNQTSSVFRVRVVAFDGQALTTHLALDDLLMVTPTVTQIGFVLEHHVRRAPYNVREEYLVLPGEVIKIASNDAAPR